MKDRFVPVIETLQLGRLRLWGPVPPADVNVALVLFRAGQPLWGLPPGETLTAGMARWGGYTVYRVDVSPRRLVFNWELPSANLGAPFAVTARALCRVIDPVAVVRERISDVGIEIERHVEPLVRRETRKHPGHDAGAVEQALADVLNDPSRWGAEPRDGRYGAVRATDWTVMVTPEPGAVVHERTLLAQTRTHAERQQDLEHEHARELARLEKAREERESLMAEIEKHGPKAFVVTWLQQRPDEVETLLRLVLSVEQDRRTDYLQALRTLVDNGGLEAYEGAEQLKLLLANLTSSMQAGPELGSLRSSTDPGVLEQADAAAAGPDQPDDPG
jgi:hypothetical protein